MVRVLGARQVVQAGLAQFWLARSFPAEPLLGLGVGVDALHALSMVPVVAAAPRWRRPALVSGLTAAAFAIAGAWPPAPGSSEAMIRPGLGLQFRAADAEPYRVR